jgi:hypothetical protein
MLRRWYLGTFLAAIMGFSLSLWAGPMRDRIEVDFSHPVMIGTQELPAGHYTFVHMVDKSPQPIFRVVNAQGTNVAMTPIAVKTTVKNGVGTPATPSRSDIVLEKVGGQYYLHKILVAGRHRGWEFSLPQGVQSQMSQAQEEHVTGSYQSEDMSAGQSTNAASPNTPSPMNPQR